MERFGPRNTRHRRLAELCVSMIYDYFLLLTIQELSSVLPSCEAGKAILPALTYHLGNCRFWTQPLCMHF